MAMELLDFCARQALEDTAPRAMAVLDPLPVTIVNYASDEDETLEAPWHGKHPQMGTRAITFGRSLAIEREDFMEEPPRKFRRLSPGGLVRLRYGYVVRCDEVVRNDAGGRGRAALHLLPRVEERQRYQRAEAKGRDPLGQPAIRAGGDGARVRPAVLRAGPGPGEHGGRAQSRVS